MCKKVHGIRKCLLALKNIEKYQNCDIYVAVYLIVKCFGNKKCIKLVVISQYVCRGWPTWHNSGYTKVYKVRAMESESRV